MPTIADRGVAAKSESLRGKSIAFALCGGIAVVETVKAIRELRRRGARITPYVTPSVSHFITPLSVEWAAEAKVVDALGPEVDHLDPYDLVVVAPATWNTIAKSAQGLADNAVTLLIASQLGRRDPLLFVPTMNSVLRAHPLYDDCVKRLEGWGARFLESEEEEGRRKLPPPERIADAVQEIWK